MLIHTNVIYQQPSGTDNAKGGVVVYDVIRKLFEFLRNLWAGQQAKYCVKINHITYVHLHFIRLAPVRPYGFLETSFC